MSKTLYTGYTNNKVSYKFVKMPKFEFITIIYNQYRDYDFSYIACLLDAFNWIYLYKLGYSSFQQLEEFCKLHNGFDSFYYFNIIN